MNTSYFDLVVKIVRGQTPIPEFQGYQFDKKAEAETLLQDLRKKYKKKSTGSFLMDILMRLSPRFLNKAWKKMSPAALTMCGEKSINQLKESLWTIHNEKIPGDFIETGVWRGGMTIIMRAFLEQVQDRSRKVIVADSFRGLPITNLSDSRDQAAQELMTPLNQLANSRKAVENAFAYFGLLDQQVKFVEGWFQDTLPRLEETQFAMIRLDGDYYESTKPAIESLYPKLSVGGYVVVDDYNLPLGCKKAIDEYREKHQITTPLIKINRQAVYWRKEKA